MGEGGSGSIAMWDFARALMASPIPRAKARGRRARARAMARARVKMKSKARAMARWSTNDMGQYQSITLGMLTTSIKYTIELRNQSELIEISKKFMDYLI